MFTLNFRCVNVALNDLVSAAKCTRCAYWMRVTNSLSTVSQLMGPLGWTLHQNLSCLARTGPYPPRTILGLEKEWKGLQVLAKPGLWRKCESGASSSSSSPISFNPNAIINGRGFGSSRKGKARGYWQEVFHKLFRFRLWLDPGGQQQFTMTNTAFLSSGNWSNCVWDRRYK